MALQAEKLIETVRKHEILYVSTSKSYKDNKQKVRGVTSPMSWIWTMRKEVSETLHLPSDDTQSIDDQDTETDEQQWTADDSSVITPGAESAVSIPKQKFFASPKWRASRTDANTGARTDNVGKEIVKYFQSRQEKMKMNCF